MIRVPGSLNSKSGSSVTYWPLVSSSGKLPSYTLQELGKLLDVAYKHPETSPSALPVFKKSERSSAARKAHSGFIKLAESRVRQLYKLEKLRGCFRDGVRSFAVLYLSCFLRQLGTPAETRWKLAHDLGERCKPPLPAPEIRHQILSSDKYNHFQNAIISQILRITPAEAEHLETWKAAFQQPRASRRSIVCGLIADFLSQGKVRAQKTRFPSIKTLRAYLREFQISCPRSSLYNYVASLQVRPREKLDASQLQKLIDLARTAF